MIYLQYGINRYFPVLSHHLYSLKYVILLIEIAILALSKFALFIQNIFLFDWLLHQSPFTSALKCLVLFFFRKYNKSKTNIYLVVTSRLQEAMFGRVKNKLKQTKKANPRNPCVSGQPRQSLILFGVDAETGEEVELLQDLGG